MSKLPFTEECPEFQQTPFLTAAGAGCSIGDTTGKCLAGGGTIHSWGQAQSCNIVNCFMSAQANCSTSVINSNSVVQSNTIIVNASCDPNVSTCKKFNASHENVNQYNLIDMDSVQMAFTSNTAQQTLNLSIMQSATAVVKGLSVMPQQSLSSNIMNTFMRCGITINTNIQQICESTQKNYLEVNTDNYGTVDLSHSVFNQTNEDTSKCTQLAVTKNDILQTLTESLSQVSESLSQGLNMFALLIVIAIIICVVIMVGGGVMVKSEESGGIFKIIGLVSALIGALFLMLFFVIRPTKGLWYSITPGIPDSNCGTSFTYDSSKHYDKSSQAVKDCMKNSKYIGMDYVVDDASSETSDAGTARFYKGNIDKTKDCTDITQPNTTETNNSIYEALDIRNPKYINVSLRGNFPTEETEGDICLDMDTGNLFYKYPLKPIPNSKTENGWKKPSYIINYNGVPGASYMKDNVFDGISESLNSHKVYFYIDIDHTTLVFPPGVYKPYPLEDYSAEKPLGNTKGTPTSGDYFVVPYPFGETSNESEKEQYQYGATFYLYGSIKDESTNKYVPNWGNDKANVPISKIPGYGIVPIYTWNLSTFLKFKQKNYWFLWITGILFFLAFLCFIAAIMSGKKKSKDGDVQMKQQMPSSQTSSQS